MLKIVGIVFLGIVLIVAGTTLATQAISFTTAQRQLVQLGPLRAGTSNWSLAVPPIAGAILLVGGTILVFAGVLVRRGGHREHGGDIVEASDARSPAQSTTRHA